MYSYDYRYDDLDCNEYECPHCEKNEICIFDSTECLKKIISQLYTEKPLCTDQFESDLEDLCHYLGETIPGSPIQIQRAWKKRR